MKSIKVLRTLRQKISPRKNFERLSEDYLFLEASSNAGHSDFGKEGKIFVNSKAEDNFTDKNSEVLEGEDLDNVEHDLRQTNRNISECIILTDEDPHKEEEKTKQDKSSESASVCANIRSCDSKLQSHESRYIPCFDDPDYVQNEYDDDCDIMETSREQEASCAIATSSCDIAHKSTDEQHEQLATCAADTPSSVSSLNVGSSMLVTRRSGGTFVNEKLYVDSHINSAIIKSDPVSHRDLGQPSGPRESYRTALMGSDITSLRKSCELRGIEHNGLARYTMIEQLLNSFSFLK